MDSVFGDSRSGLATQPPPLASGGNPRDALARVPRHVGLIEPWIGASLAAYTACLFAVTNRDPLLWVWAAGALLLAFWSSRSPATRQRALLLRAAVFSAMGLAMIWRAGVHEADGGAVFFYWVSLPTLFYALLLRSSLAWGLLAVNLLATALVLLLAAPGVTAASIVGCLGFLAAFGGAAIRMGAVLRRTDELLEARRVDVGSGMLNEYGFVDYGAELWADCRRASAPAVLVFLDVPDLPRLRQLYGSITARMAAEKVQHLMRALGAGRNLAGRLSGSRYALLLPGCSRDEALQFLADRLGGPPQIELDDDFELILPVNVHAAESRMQNVSFSRFFAAEHEMLDFYFSDRRPEAGVDAPAQAVAAGTAPVTSAPVVRPEPISRWNSSDQTPSTVPFGQH